MAAQRIERAAPLRPVGPPAAGRGRRSAHFRRTGPMHGTVNDFARRVLTAAGQDPYFRKANPMKGIPALIVAAGGCIGFLLNYFYLSPATQHSPIRFGLRRRQTRRDDQSGRCLEARGTRNGGISPRAGSQLHWPPGFLHGRKRFQRRPRRQHLPHPVRGCVGLRDDVRTAVQESLDLGNGEGVGVDPGGQQELHPRPGHAGRYDYVPWSLPCPGPACPRPRPATTPAACCADRQRP